MTATAWAHLPNAVHIDRILADLNANPEDWDAARDAAWDAARDAAWVAARDAAWVAAWGAARGAARGAAWGAVRGAAWGAVRGAARGAISALVAWDDCAYLLDLPPETLRAIIRMDNGVGKHQAVLLLPGSIVFSKRRDRHARESQVVLGPAQPR